MVISKSTEITNVKAFPSRRHNARERKVLETAESFSPTTSTDWDSTQTTLSGAVDELASKIRAMECIVATYDFATHGGTIGAKALSVTIPDNFVIMGIYAHVITAITDGAGGSPTIQLLAATDDISTLSTQLDESDTAGVCQCITAYASTAPIITTGARALNATIGSANLTAGKIRWFIVGFQSI